MDRELASFLMLEQYHQKLLQNNANNAPFAEPQIASWLKTTFSDETHIVKLQHLSETLGLSSQTPTSNVNYEELLRQSKQLAMSLNTNNAHQSIVAEAMVLSLDVDKKLNNALEHEAPKTPNYSEANHSNNAQTYQIEFVYNRELSEQLGQKSFEVMVNSERAD